MTKKFITGIVTILFLTSCIEKEDLLGTVTTKTSVSAENITLYDSDYEFEITNSKEVSSSRYVVYVGKKVSEDDDGNDVMEYEEVSKGDLKFSGKKAKLPINGSFNPSGTSITDYLKSKYLHEYEFKMELFSTVDGVESRQDFSIYMVSAIAIPSNKKLQGIIESKEEFEFSYKIATTSDVTMDEVKLHYKIVPKGTSKEDAEKIVYQEVSAAVKTALGTFKKKGKFSKKLKKGDIVSLLNAKLNDVVHYKFVIKKGEIEDSVEKSFTVKSQILMDSEKITFSDIVSKVKDVDGNYHSVYNLYPQKLNDKEGHFKLELSGTNIIAVSNTASLPKGATRESKHTPQLVKMSGVVADKFKAGDLIKIRKEFNDTSSKITQFIAKKGDAYIYKVIIANEVTKKDKTKEIKEREYYGVMLINEVTKTIKDGKANHSVSVSMRNGYIK